MTSGGREPESGPGEPTLYGMGRAKRMLLSVFVLLGFLVAVGLVSVLVPECATEPECDPISPAGLLILYLFGIMIPVALGLNAELDQNYRATLIRARPIARLAVMLAALFWTAVTFLLYLGEWNFISALTALALWRLAYDIRPAAGWAAPPPSPASR